MIKNDLSVVCSILVKLMSLIFKIIFITFEEEIVMHGSINIFLLFSTINGPGLPTVDNKKLYIIKYLKIFALFNLISMLRKYLSYIYKVIFCMKMDYNRLLKIIEEGDIRGLRESEKELAMYIDYEMRTESSPDYGEDMYLIYHLTKYPECVIGLRMFEIFRWVCRNESHYHWYEVMRKMAYPALCGALKSKNIKILDHLICHLDESEVYKNLPEDENYPINKWYDEKFIT